MTIVIGIDIGLTGAVAFVDHRGCVIADLPAPVDKQLEGRPLLDLLRSQVPAGMTAMAIIEAIRARPMGNGGAHGNSMHSQGSLMHSLGVVQAVLSIAGIRCHKVEPQTWKRHYGLIKAKKEAALPIARSLYPGSLPMLTRLKDHNRADAVLIAHYGHKVLA